MRAPLVLASASPRRRELLLQAGIECEVRPAAIDETPRRGEDAAAYVSRLACGKAAAVPGDDRPVLGADTAVVVDGHILGKPADAGEAQRMLRRLSGRSHEVLSAVALLHGGAARQQLVAARVTMRVLDDAEIDAYCASDEPWDKAGAYAVQGRAAAFVERIDGSYTAVVGLPLYETLALLRDAGITPWTGVR